MPVDQPTRREWIGLGALTALRLAAVEFNAADPALAQQPVAQQPTEKPDLIARLTELETAYDGTFSIDAGRLDAPGSFMLRPERILPTASTCKLFILCELFRQAEAGKLDLNAPITWKPEHHRGGDGILRAMVPGQELSVHNMAVLMITLSDNIATAVLTELVGPAAINASLKPWNLADSNFHDGLPGGPDAARMKQPVSSARDLRSLVTLIYRHEILSEKSCDEIIRILRAQRVNDMLPRYIEIGEDWGQAKTWIANKTGYGECRVDVGLVHTDKLTLAMAVFFKPNKAPPHRLKSMSDYPPVLAAAHACKAVYDHFADG